jgi:hypothetical protein
LGKELPENILVKRSFQNEIYSLYYRKGIVRKYVTTLLEKGISKESIYCYGFAFEGKKVLIGE